MITFGEKLKIYIEQEGLNLKKFSEKAGVEYSAFRNLLVNFKRNKGSLQIFLKYCDILGYRVEFVLINKETQEKIRESGMTLGSLIKIAMSVNKMTTAEVANVADITTTAVNKRIRQLSDNTGTINKMIEFVNLIGYDVEIEFVK